VKKTVVFVLSLLFVPFNSRTNLDLIEANSFREIRNKIKQNHELCFEFLEKALQRANFVPQKTTKLLVEFAEKKNKQRLENLLRNAPQNKYKYQTFFAAFLKKTSPTYLRKKFPHIFGAFEILTQSEWHLKKHKKLIKDYLEREFPAVRNNEDAIKMLLELDKREQEETKKGRYVFIHGQGWKWNFLSDVFKELWELKYNETVTDYQFLRFKPKCKNLNDEIKKRERALHNRDDYNSIGSDIHGCAGRIFMNHAVFGSATRYNGFSIRYWIEKRNMNNNGIPVKRLFKKMGMEKFFKKYKKELKKLEKLHEESSKYGSLLLISCTSEQVEKAVIPSDYFGKRIDLEITGRWFSNTTHNAKQIIDSLTERANTRMVDDNMIQYCLLLTQDCALDPHNGPRIYTFHAANEKKFAQYKKLKDEIFSQIAADMKH